MHYYEWWSRALKPGVHFVEVDEGDAMCDDIVRKVGPVRSTCSCCMSSLASLQRCSWRHCCCHA